MSSFDALESGTEGSRPIELYDFSLGSDSFCFTSAEDQIVVTGLGTFEPEAISRTSIAQGTDERNRIVEIALPATNQFASKYIDIVPGELASVTITRLQRDEVPTFNTQTLVFKGLVQSVRFPGNGQQAIIGSKSIEAATSRSIPRFTYQGLCNHVLYDSGCQVDPSGFKLTSAEVESASGNTITVTGADGFADGFFDAGFVSPTGFVDRRLVLSHVGKVLTLLLPFPGTIVGNNVDVFAGCDHRIDGDCKNRFDNVRDFGGFAFVPSRNIFDTGIQ